MFHTAEMPARVEAFFAKVEPSWTNLKVDKYEVMTGGYSRLLAKVELHHDGAARSRGLFGVQTTPVSLSLPGGAFTSARHGCGGQAGCPWGRW